MMHGIVVRLALCATLVALATGAVAQQDVDSRSANYIFPGCKALAQGEPPTEARLLMRGHYCNGVLYALTGASRFIEIPFLRSCPPEGGAITQAARVFVKFLEQHPERLHEDFRMLALEAMHEAWPCE